MQPKTVKSILFFFLIVVLCQCNTKQQGSHAAAIDVNGSKVIDCNISEVTDTIDFLLSDLIDNCEMIPLETNDSSLFESIYHIGISENYIAIHSRGRMPIKLFSRKGKFIRNVGKIGRGPGEFNSLYGIQLDEVANKIYLTPFANAKNILVYSLDNKVLPQIALLYKQTKFQAYIENDVVTVLSMPFKVTEGKPNPVVFQQSLDGELIKEYRESEHLVINPRNEKGQFVGFNSEISSSHNTGAYDVFTLNYGNKGYDTLYHYDTKVNKMLPKYVSSFNDKKHGSWTREWKSHYWTAVFGKKYGGKIIVDKKTLKSDYFKLINDFFGEIEMHKFYMSNNGMFICSMSALELITAFEEALKNDDLSAKQRKEIEVIQKSLNENDNEILFIGEMI